MKYLTTICRTSMLGCIAATTLPTLAATEPRGYYATIYAQASRLGSTSFDENGNGGLGAGLTAKFDMGFGFGGDIGFRYGNGWAAEVEWNYRRHDLKSLSGSTTTVNDGDFASNIFFINGLRRFPSASGGGHLMLVRALAGFKKSISTSTRPAEIEHGPNKERLGCN